MITAVVSIAALNLLVVIANARVFKRLHERDEEILRMMDEDMLLMAQVPYKRTGS